MWYVKFSETNVRKGTIEQLQALVAKGRISESTLLRFGTEGPWVAAGSVAELFPQQPLDDLSALSFPSAAAPANPLLAPAVATTTSGTAPPSRKWLLYGAISIVSAIVLLLVVLYVKNTPAGSDYATHIAYDSSIAVPLDPNRAVEVGPRGADLLSYVSPETHTYQGTPEKIGSNLYTTGQQSDVVQISLPLPEQYTIDVVAQPQTKPEALHIGLVIGGKQVAFIVDAFEATRSGLYSIKGHRLNSSSYQGCYTGAMFTPNKPGKIRVCVTPKSVTAWFNNRPVYRWEGDPQDLDWNMPYPAPDKPCLLVGGNRCRYEISKWWFTNGINEPRELQDLESLQLAGYREIPRPEKVSANMVASQQQMLDLPALVALVEPSIVRIDVIGPFGRGVGSGFVINDSGIVITNFHVIAGGKAVKLSFSDRTVVNADALIAVDRGKDLAMLRFDGKSRPSRALPMATDLPNVGESVAAFGAPQGLSFTASNGIVSAVRSGIELQQFGANFTSSFMVQTSAPISPGNSGGPLVDMQGRVVGVNTVQLRAGQNLNFAVSNLDVSDVYADARVKIQNNENLAVYDSKYRLKSIEQFSEEQMAGLKLPATECQEWVINGKTTTATLVSIQTTEEKPRQPADLLPGDFVNGKYTPPQGLRVRLKGANGKERDFELSNLDNAGGDRVRQRWLDEVNLTMKRRLVERGNAALFFMFATDRQRPEKHRGLTEPVCAMCIIADQRLSSEDAQQVRALIMQGLSLSGAETPLAELQKRLDETEAELKNLNATDKERKEKFDEISIKAVLSDDQQ